MTFSLKVLYPILIIRYTICSPGFSPILCPKIENSKFVLILKKIRMKSILGRNSRHENLIYYVIAFPVIFKQEIRNNLSKMSL